MAARRKWSREEDLRLVDGYLRGETLSALAEAVDCKVFHVWHRVEALRQLGYDLPERKPRWTTQRRQQLAKRRRQGASLRELQEEFGITRGTLTSQLRTLRKLGYDTEESAPELRSRRRNG